MPMLLPEIQKGTEIKERHIEHCTPHRRNMKRSASNPNLGESAPKRQATTSSAINSGESAKWPAENFSEMVLVEPVDSGIESFPDDSDDSDDGAGQRPGDVPAWFRDTLCDRAYHIDRATFQSIVRAIAQGMKNDLRFQGSAILALQAAAGDLCAEGFLEAGFQAIRTGEEDGRTVNPGGLERAVENILQVAHRHYLGEGGHGGLARGVFP